jgi:pimeloyl-ACP methyl ester carboxylesterase
MGLNGEDRWTLPGGKVHRRVLRSNPAQEYFVYVPFRGGTNEPVLVTVHGQSRNAKEQAELFSEYCEALGVVLVVPHFPADVYPDYQRLGRRGSRADLALNAIVEEAGLLTGASVERIYLFGFSGGAQFAHRYAMAFPDRVASAVCVAAGWYTFPDARRRFPYGIRPRADLPGVRFDPEEFLRVPMTVIIGENDTEQDGGLRRSDKLDEQQGVNRVERARNWVAAMQAAAVAYRMESLVTFGEAPDACHSFRRFMHVAQLGDLVMRRLFSVPARRRQPVDVPAEPEARVPRGRSRRAARVPAPSRRG